MESHLKFHPSLKVPHVYTAIFLSILAAKFVIGSEYEVFHVTWRLVVAGGAALLLYTHIRRITTTYTLDAIELVEASGILSRRIVRVPLNRISNYQVTQSFVERILGLGSVLVDTPGGHGHELKMHELDTRAIQGVVRKLTYLIGQQKIAEAGQNDTLRQAREIALGGRESAPMTA